MNARTESEQVTGFRAIMGSFPTGVTVVTARRPGCKSVGFTANAVASTSLDPPMLLVCASMQLYSTSVIEETRLFGVNFLDQSQEAISRWFATSSERPKFLESAKTSIGLRQQLTDRYVPVLDGVTAYAECELRQIIPAGDHYILVGEVVDGFAQEGTPLLYFRGRYFAAPTAEPVAERERR